MNGVVVLLNLEETFNDFENARHQVLNQMKKLNAEQLRFKPDANAWCLLEVLQHLILVEQGFLRQTRTDFDKLPKNMKYHPRIGSVILWVVFTFGLRVRMPVKGVAPKEIIPLERLAAEWEEKRSAIRSYLDSIDPILLKRPVFFHPVSGAMAPLGAIRFLHIHFNHHRKQIARIQRSRQFPKNLASAAA